MPAEPSNPTDPEPFFRLLEIDIAELSRHSNALDRMRRGELHGVLVHNLYDPAILEEVVDRLEQRDPPFVQTWFPEAFRSWFFGCNLNLTDDLHYYFAEAPVFMAQLEELFPHDFGVNDYLAPILSTLDNGRPFQTPPGPEPGSHYMFTTIRAHMEGGFIPPHVDNEQTIRPSYAHLRTLVDSHIMSFVVSLCQPEDGGALEIYNSTRDVEAKTLTNDDRAEPPNIDGIESVAFQLPAGSMILVDSGQYLHRVSPVVGSRKRWAMCSFMALSRNQESMYCWG